MSDRIYLKQVRGYGYTGVLPEEKVLGQWFEVDATLWVDVRTAGQSDRLADTLDYRAAIACIQSTIAENRFDLVERLVEAIATELLDLDLVTQVTVRVTKPSPPIPNFVGQVAVEITRPTAQPVE
jgi:dihydroneopterin aldolase